MNQGLVFILLKFAGLSLLVLLAVFVVAVITPKLARFIDNMRNPERVKAKEKDKKKKCGPYDFDEDEINGIYDMKKTKKDKEEDNNGE